MTLLKQTTVSRADENLTGLDNDDDLQTDCCTFSLTGKSLEKDLQTLTLEDPKSSKTELSCESGIASFSANYSSQSLETLDKKDAVTEESAPCSTQEVQSQAKTRCVKEKWCSDEGEKVFDIPTRVNRTKEHEKQKEKLRKIAEGLPEGVCSCFQDKDGDTLLHLAVLQTVTHLAQLVRLLGLHGQVNSRNRLYQTPLHLAVLTGNGQALSLLRTLGASLFLQDCHGNTPLHTACLRNDPRILRLLLKGEASDTDKNKRKSSSKEPRRSETTGQKSSKCGTFRSEDSHGRLP